MVKLLDILNEAKQAGTLYHSTNGENLISILKSNTLDLNKDKEDWTHTTGKVFFTRDKQYRPGEYTIEIDGNKVSDRYGITPSSFSGRGEAEEVIKKPITNFKSYIKDIYANIQIVERRPYRELEKIMRIYPGLKFTSGGYYTLGDYMGPLEEIPKQEALTYIKYNKY